MRNASPKPAKIRDRTPAIRATVENNVTNLKKAYLKPYVAGKRTANSKFRYSASTDDLLYNSLRPTNGETVVKIVAGDAAGNVRAKS